MREDEFSELAATYQSELRAHCYRMLGSVPDAEDALQEALVRAWKGIGRFEGRGPVRSWLYSIATNTALDIAKHRSRREFAVDMGTPAGPGAELGAPLTDLPWLEPYPDQWLAPNTEPSPEARFEHRESIELAFVAAVQYLPPLQRAVLLLREVAGFSAAEIASQLGTSAESVTSALQRARVTVQTRLPARSQQSTLRMLGDRRTRDIVHRYADAMERGDIQTLVGMLTQDVTWSMPPVPTWFCGLEPVRDFLVRYPLTDRWKHRPARANGQLAVAGYVYDQDQGGFIPAAIDVLTLEAGKIAAVTGFLTADLLGRENAGGWVSGAELFKRFGLPADPLFPFGYGLSYTKFSFSNLKVGAFNANGNATVTATVTNTGSVAGADVAQMYVGDPAASQDLPEQLKGFQRATLNPGQSATVSFPLTVHDLASWSAADNAWEAQAGTYSISVGDSSASLPLTGSTSLAHELTGQVAAGASGAGVSLANTAVSANVTPDSGVPGGDRRSGQPLRLQQPHGRRGVLHHAGRRLQPVPDPHLHSHRAAARHHHRLERDDLRFRQHARDLHRDRDRDWHGRSLRHGHLRVVRRAVTLAPP